MWEHPHNSASSSSLSNPPTVWPQPLIRATKTALSWCPSKWYLFNKPRLPISAN